MSSKKQSSLEAIMGELDSGAAGRRDIGMFTIKTANKTLTDAAQRPNPRNLYQYLWYEGEVCCMFSDSNLGKSILAVQIAEHIAQTDKVLLVDCELSDKQFQLRYTDEVTGYMHLFPENFLRAEINPTALRMANYEEMVIENIKEMANKEGIRFIIVDNLTYLCNASDKGDIAGVFMGRLMDLKKNYDLSLLIVAHTPKRSLTSPITQNDLAGSKKLYNFFDSVFAIGRSATDRNLRYVKQLKVRAGEFRYDADNIMVYEIIKTDGFLHFEFREFSTEREHLKSIDENYISDRERNVLELKAQGKSLREIATMTDLSKSSVDRILKKHPAVPDCPTVPDVGQMGHLGQGTQQGSLDLKDEEE